MIQHFPEPAVSLNRSMALKMPLGPSWAYISRTYGPGCIRISTGKTLSQKLVASLKHICHSRISARIPSIHIFIAIISFLHMTERGSLWCCFVTQGPRVILCLNFPSFKISLNFIPMAFISDKLADSKCRGVSSKQSFNWSMT